MKNSRGNGTSTTVTGFTLIELMVALAIIAIIAAIAIPSYTSYSQRGYRAEAMADLMNCAQGMERFAAVNFIYQGAVDTDMDNIGDSDTGDASANICTPLSMAASPRRYLIEIDATPPGFDLTATPQNAGPNAGDGIITLSSTGARTWDVGGDGTVSAADNDWTE